MKTSLKYLSVVTLAIMALTWPSLKVSSTEGEESTDKDEFKVSEVYATAEERADDAEEGVAAREAFRRMQLQDENGEIPPDAWIEAYQEKEAMPFLREAWAEFLPPPDPMIAVGPDDPDAQLPWVTIGPGNIGGRIRSLVIHPDHPEIMLAGGVTGGIWKSTNGGGEWIPKTDSVFSMGVACLAIDPGQHDTVYAGTGESYPGSGIYKTTDFGNTWTPLVGTVTFGEINRIAISPRNRQLLLAATKTGIYRSVNGGAGWVRTGLPGINVRDIDFQPGNAPTAPLEPETPTINCVAGTHDSNAAGAYYSIDDGATWLPASGLPTPNTRVELAYSRSQPLIVYASVSAGTGVPRALLYKSLNGGLSFTKTTNDPIVGNQVGAFDWANCLWVDPTNPNNVLVGGQFLHRTKQGGEGVSDWQEASSNQTHIDHHVIVEHPQYNGGAGPSPNAIVFATNDGGLRRAENILAESPPNPPPPNGPVQWTTLNKKLGVTQFYHAAGHVQTGRIIGGTQDNGTVVYRPGSGPGHGPEDWGSIHGGDGEYCAIDQTNDPYFYGESPNLQIYRSTTDSEKAQPIWDGIPHPPNGVPAANASAPFLLDPNDAAGKTMLAGGKALWRSTDVRVPGQPVWPEIKQPYPAGCVNNCQYVSAIAIAEGNSNLSWVGHNDGSVFYTTNGTAPTPTWISGDPHNILPHGTGHFCLHITIGQPLPSGFRPVYAMYGGLGTRLHVFKTTDNGENWENISSNLPKVPVYSLVISPLNPNILYVATEIALYATGNGGQSWSRSTVHPDVPVLDLFWMGPQLISVTHGRGIFTIPRNQDE